MLQILDFHSSEDSSQDLLG